MKAATYLAAGAIFVSSLFPGTVGAVEKRKTPAIVNIINAEVGKPYSDEILPEFARSLAMKGIDVSLSIIPSPNGGSISYKDPLVHDLRQLSDEFPDSIEIGVNGHRFTDDEFLGDVYKQARNASEAQSAFTEAFDPMKDPAVQKVIMAQTLNVPYHAYDRDTIAAVRQAGIKVIMSDPKPNHKLQDATEKDIERGYRKNRNGVTEIFLDKEGYAIESYSPLKVKNIGDLKNGIKTQMKGDDDPLVITIPIAAVYNALGEKGTAKYLDEIEGLLEEFKGSVDYMLPREFYMKKHDGPGRYILLRADDERVNVLGEEDRRAFLKELSDRGLKVTNAVIPLGYGQNYWKPLINDDKTVNYLNSQLGNMEIAIHGLKHTIDELVGLRPEDNRAKLQMGLEQFRGLDAKVMTLVPPYNSFDQATLKAMEKLGLKVISADHRDRHFFGIDRFGIYHMSNTYPMEKSWEGDCEYFTPEEMMDQFGKYNDVVLMVHPQTVKGKNRERFFRLLDILQKDKDIGIVNLNGFYEKVFPSIPSLSHIQNSRIYASQDAAGPISKEMLKADATAAWDYFLGSEVKETGLNAGSVIRTASSKNMDRHLTLWDMGSLIFANIASHQLGIQGRESFEERIGNALRFLEKSPLTGEGLPMAYYSIDSFDQKSSNSFDSIDLGRLLIAMKALSVHYPVYEGRLKGIIGRYNIPHIIRDGELYGIKKGKMVKEHFFNYASYSAKGFRLWGFPVKEYTEPLDDMDSARNYINHIRSRGGISTEPFATELMEIGHSDHTKTLLDIIYGAQIALSQERKKPISISEGNIDRSPWFLFQQHVIDSKDGWITTSKSSPERPGTAFFSTKGAFLWNTLRDDSYARKLYEKSKKHDVGFVSGIYDDGAVMKVSDINTNALILQSIWYIVRGSPLLEK